MVLVLDVLVQCRLEDKVRREELEDGEVSLLEGQCAMVKADRDRVETECIPDAKKRIALRRGQMLERVVFNIKTHLDYGL